MDVVECIGSQDVPAGWYNSYEGRTSADHW